MNDPPLYDPAFDPPAQVRKKGGPQPGGRADWGRLSFWFALLSNGLFLGAGLHVDADRRRRIPVVTWEPLGLWLLAAAFMAGCLAIVLMTPALRRSGSLSSWAGWAIILDIWGAVWFLVYLCALYET